MADDEVLDDYLSNPGLDLYLEQLQKADTEVARTERAMERARFNFDMALKQYALVRDVLWDRFQLEPYRGEQIPGGAEEHLMEVSESNDPFPTHGRFRFVHMQPGDAIAAALRELRRPVTFDELVALLREGGMEIPDARVINAALRHRRDVKRLPDGTYQNQVRSN